MLYIDSYILFKSQRPCFDNVEFRHENKGFYQGIENNNLVFFSENAVIKISTSYVCAIYSH